MNIEYVKHEVLTLTFIVICKICTYLDMELFQLPWIDMHHLVHSLLVLELQCKCNTTIST